MLSLSYTQNNRGEVVISLLCCCQVEMERLRMEEKAASIAREKAQLERTVCNLQQELTEKQDWLQTLQVNSYRLMGQTRKHVAIQYLQFNFCF